MDFSSRVKKAQLIERESDCIVVPVDHAPLIWNLLVQELSEFFVA